MIYKVYYKEKSSLSFPCALVKAKTQDLAIERARRWLDEIENAVENRDYEIVKVEPMTDVVFMAGDASEYIIRNGDLIV